MDDDTSLMDKGRAQNAEPAEGGAEFKKPNIAQFVPPAMKDVVDRVVAAGVKVMYSPQMREQVRSAIESTQPTPQKLAENVTGLLLTIDQQTPNGIPAEALFPVGIELLGEGAEVLQAAGQKVTQEDFNEAARTLFVMVGQKLGGTPEQIMGAAAQAIPGQEGEEGGKGEQVAEPAAPMPGEEEMPDEEMPPQQPVV